jgi:phosphoribosylaminoimidazole-succinocarboxamide synthase
MAGFEISADLIRALEAKVMEYGEAANEAYGIARETVKSEVMRRAQASPRWVKVADEIDTWDENDRFWVGVRSPEFVSEAFAAEYGTDEYPPEPLLRTLDAAARVASHKANGFLVSRLGDSAATP